MIFGTKIPTQEEFAMLRLWREIKKCLVYDYGDSYGIPKLDIVESARKWLYYRRTDPPYFRDHWQEYNELAYKYLYPAFDVFPEIMQTWDEEYKKIEKRSAEKIVGG